MEARLLLSVLSVSTFIFPSRATCYWPDGTATSSAYAPCSNNLPEGVASMCYQAFDGDICRPDGLVTNGQTMFRGGCTNPNFSSLGCANLCLFLQNPSVTECTDGSYCCNVLGRTQPNSTCCAAGLGVNLPLTATLGQTATQSSTITPSTATASQTTSRTTSHTVSATATQSPSNSGKISTASEIGAIVGPVCSVLGLLWAVGFGIWRHKKKQKKQRELDMQNSHWSSFEPISMRRVDY
ncbi:hypothetical protein BT63DRAFT_454281 [Microthyrium microscopicum]|uniref:Mid2 domain-containing protein n=1 Tax=Microthyrium microscopicum TaxID=703497 RepID=A0A6A6UEW2_9PEZI|nr:hypothetical protein BT63DRAFT_454281 [Microthyrium microscopicum]